ncbi:KTSC domain-containing protein [Afifella sp. H1R]|uniref:KTSC domain-containing protein n=1 Tax=Afifella sp. H1R TaxID=2908841 RepID=UPI001F2ECA88|nr:KTSC domain-containing protein [Afifella sp. H1R]MCF1503466.1 KTSC domain-containing protein [Afifella sp. H1R]
MEVLEHVFQSEALKQALYVPAEKALFIAFQTGRIYRYDHVPKAIFTGLTEAQSAGAYFNAVVRHYPYREVETTSLQR